MSTFITVIHVIVSVFLMLTVLLQSGKGGGMGAAFGGGNTGTVFGGSGASSFLRRLTVGAAVVFMLTSMLLAYLASQTSEDALRAFSASQRRQRELKEKLREDALEGNSGTAPDQGANAPGGDQGATPPSGDQGAAPVDTGDQDQAPVDTGDQDKPGATGTKKPADDVTKPDSSGKPAGDAPTPAGDAAKPTGDAAKPAGGAAKPAGDATAPASKPAGGAATPARPDPATP